MDKIAGMLVFTLAELPRVQLVEPSVRTFLICLKKFSPGLSCEITLVFFHSTNQLEMK